MIALGYFLNNELNDAKTNVMKNEKLKLIKSIQRLIVNNPGNNHIINVSDDVMMK